MDKQNTNNEVGLNFQKKMAQIPTIPSILQPITPLQNKKKEIYIKQNQNVTSTNITTSPASSNPLRDICT